MCVHELRFSPTHARRSTESISKPKAKEHLKLARIYYFARVAELRAAIFSGIEDFKCVSGI